MLVMMTAMGLMLWGSLAQAGNPRYAGLVADAASGEVVYAEHAEAQRYPASLTKMMTLYLLFEAIEQGRLGLDDALPVSEHAAAMPASKLWLEPGDSILVREVIPALVVRSANDVAVVVAEALGGSETAFAQLMTARARAMGLGKTRFRNASGLPDAGQVTTARDMGTLAVALMRDFPSYYGEFSRTEFVFRGKRHRGHNRLLDQYAGADGLKTGFIRASGFNVATSAVRDGRRLIAVVMGGFTSRSRDAHMADLLDRGFARLGLRERSDWLADTDISGAIASLPPLAVDPHGSTMPALLASVAAEPAVSLTAGSTDPIRALMERNAQGDGGGTWALRVAEGSPR
ncbi:D-alanyl-D-alanine carboxypeptidase family protein [Halomonas sp. YLGW01]|uniref:D-alanyl-D-alanine carboxypeptidase family protein n=1 Tax=Halomonas sp. YLGW01 TaxID=2773308 RepID=UPI0032427312